MTDLDDVDWRLLAQLQQDAGETNQALAERMAISPATCMRRVRRLEQAGLIERRVALLAQELAGRHLAGIIEVSLDRQGLEHLDAFESRAVADAAVQQCWRVAPGPDFVLVVQVPDMPAYQAMVARLFTQDANVRNVKTYFSIKRSKFDIGIALPAAGSRP